jgi:hypothetical protein
LKNRKLALFFRQLNVKTLFVFDKTKFAQKSGEISGLNYCKCITCLQWNTRLIFHQIPEPIVLDNLKSTHLEPVLFLPRASTSFSKCGVGRFVKFW